jgi:hypothetical protein
LQCDEREAEPDERRGRGGGGKRVKKRERGNWAHLQRAPTSICSLGRVE